MEKWKEIEGFEAYEVSDLGRVRRTVMGRGTNAVDGVLKQVPIRKGYLRVYLSKNSNKYSKQVHRLLAEAFLPNPLGLPQVNHKDGVKAHCELSNLEWRTQLGNMQHSVKMGLHGRDIHHRKDNGKWRVRYAPTPYVRVNVGQFDTRAEAEAALDAVLKTIVYVL